VASDPDNDALTYKIDFGDGSSVEQGSVTTAPVHHIYSLPGLYTARIEVTDGKAGVVRYQRISVVLPEPLTANAGDDQQAVTAQDVTFDASASRPSQVISSYDWDFGDGTTGTGRNLTHAFSKAGTYTAKLTTRIGADSATDTATVTVTDPPAQPGLFVHVTSNGAPLPGADLTVVQPDGSRISGITGPDGVGKLAGLPDGDTSVYVWADGYTPAVVKATVSGGRGDVNVELTSGNVGATTLDYKRLTLDQIVAKGIDPTDPANQNVFEATINLYFIPANAPDNYTPPPPSGDSCTPNLIFNSLGKVLGLSGCGIGAGGGGVGGGGGGGGGGCDVTDPTQGCFILNGTFAVWPTVHYVQSQPVIQWLVIPVKVSFLKEFFDVQMVVQNLAPPGFTFTSGDAELNLPSGLSLAPTSSPQSLDIPLPDIGGGQSQSATWTVRGDTEGDYNLSSIYTAVVQPVDQPISLTAQSVKPLHVYGGSAIKMTVTVDSCAVRFGPYVVDVALKNTTSDAVVYNAQAELKDRPADAPSWQALYSIGSPHVQGTAAIPPGGTFTAHYVVYPALGNDDVTKLQLVPASSFIQRTGGNVSLATTLEVLDKGNCAQLNYYSVTTAPVTKNADPKAPDTTTVMWQQPAEFNLSDIDYYEVLATSALDQPLTPTRFSHVAANSPCSSDQLFIAGYPCITINSNDDLDMRYITVVTHLTDGRVLNLHLMGQGPARYVALGDSFSSGEGYPPFEPGSDTANLAAGQVSDNCHRSTGSYSRQLSQDISRRNDFLPVTFAACSGAITDDYAHENLENHEVAQASQVSKFTDRVTLTMGGNDAGFKWFVMACVLLDNCGGIPTGSTGPWYSRDSMIAGLNQLTSTLGCLSLSDLTSNVARVKTGLCFTIHAAIDGLAQAGDPSNPRSQGVNNLPDPSSKSYDSTLSLRLDDLYSSLLHDAPKAEVYVGNYPMAVDDSPAPCELRPDFGVELAPTGASSPNLSASEKRTIQALTNNLDGVIGNEVAKYAGTGRLHLVDVRSAFKGHELCGGSGLLAEGVRGFNSLVLPGEICGDSRTGLFGLLDATACSVHPNDIGQKAYADAFANAIPSTLRSSAKITTGQVLVAGVVVVQPGDSLSTFLQWPGSDVGLVLVSPSGTEYSRGQTPPGSTWDVTPTSEAVSIPNAESGSWTVRMRGISVAGAGETAEVFASSNAPMPTSPTAVGTIRQESSDGRTIHVDAAGSSSPNGGIASYTWFFSDGTVGSGPELDHRFSVPGVYSTRLLVTDQAGQTSSSVVGDYVTPNQAPVAHDDNFDLPTGTTLVVPARGELENDTDADGDSLSAELMTIPQHGLVDLQADGSFTYTPADGFVGSDSFTYRASDGAATSATATVSLHVSQPSGSASGPSFTHADPTLLTLVGAAYVSTFTATGSPLPDISIDSGSLPPGLTLSTAGVLEGVPTQTGTFTFGINAINTSGTALSGPFTLTVAEAPTITSLSPPSDATVGARYAISFSASGFPSPTFFLSAGTLPGGLTLDPAGTLDGTPTTPGTYTFSVDASNQVGAASAGPFTLTVTQKPAFTVASPPTTAVVGDSYQYQFTTTGSPSPVIALASGALPGGLTLSPDGQITGTPTTSGTFTFSVTATNSAGVAAAGPFTITIAQRPAFTASNPATSAVVGTPYEYQFATTGSPIPTLAVAGGTLPNGLVLSPSGSLTGTPTAPGQFTFSVNAGNGAGSTTVGPFTINVYQAPAFTSGNPTGSATVGTAYSFDFVTSGSPSPTIVISGGALPGGLSLSTTGSLRGTPTQSGTFQFTVSASNQAGSTSAGPFTISVNETPSFTSGTPPLGAVNAPYSFTFTALGAPAPTFSLATGTLPPGLTLAPDGVLSGAPTSSGTYSFSVAATNAVGTVNAGPFDLVVTSLNHTPSAVSQSLSVSAGASLPVTLSGIDPDGDPLTYAVTVAPSHGRLTGTAPNLVYSPSAGYIGADTFDFTVSDGLSVSAPATVSISVNSTTILNLSLPTVTGATKVGETLTASAGGWSPSGVTFTYQWLRNGSAVRAATGATYVPTPSDVGAKFSVRVTASLSGYTSVSATSGRTLRISLGTITVTSLPTISGNAKVGATLTSSTGTWSQSGLKYVYAWFRDGRVIRDATRSSYRLTSADAGHKVNVRVTVSKSGYVSANANSAQTAVVLR
jgi:PKD repeat protein